MYNYSELEAMDDSQLREVAQTNGIKKINLDDKENLVYEILDKQARDVASSSTANTPQKNRRGKSTLTIKKISSTRFLTSRRVMSQPARPLTPLKKTVAAKKNPKT